MHKIGFALTPTSADQTSLFDLANNVAMAHPCSFVMRPRETIPHVSMFQGVFKDRDEVLETFERLPLSPTPDRLPIDGLSIWATKIVFLDLRPHPWLQALHEQIFATFFPLAAGRSADPQAFTGITAGQAKSFSETGYPFSQTEYLPHFTIAHLANEALEGRPGLKTIAHQNTVTFAEFVCFAVGDKGVVLDVLTRRALTT